MAQPEFYSGKTLYPVIGVLIALSVLFGLVIMPRLAPAGGRLVEKPAPDFTLPVIANGDPGARMHLADLREKVVVLEFWASWCKPCAIQAPILDRVARRYPDDVVVLGINVESDDTPELVKRYARQKGLTYPMLQDLRGEAQGPYQATSLPTVVVIDRQGNIAELVRGVYREELLDRAIRDLRGS